jgi:hypothetical protein
MKNLSLSLGRVTLVLATAFSLGACGRADYAPLSRATTQPASTIAQATPYVPVASEASATVKAVTPTQSAPAASLAMQPAPATVEVAPVASAVAPAAPVAVAPVAAAAPHAKVATAPKLNIVQRLALRKISKKLDNLTAKAPQFKQRDASAARGGIEGNLRSALLFGLIGIILLLFSGVSSIFGILGTILLIIGLVFLVLWLLDQA